MPDARTLVDNYDFTKGKDGYIISQSLTQLSNTSYLTDFYKFTNDGMIIYSKAPRFDVITGKEMPDKYTIEFSCRYIDFYKPSYGWNHIFSFGWHHSSGGGDIPYYSLCVEPPRDGVGYNIINYFGPNTVSILSNHMFEFEIQVDFTAKTIAMYMNGGFLKKFENITNITNKTPFYFFGTGFGEASNGILKSLKIYDGYNVYPDKPVAYTIALESKGDIYGYQYP
jgi:hypothetical protein